MAIVRPFRALRPVPEKAADVASPPYDVMNTAEARKMVEAQPNSFLRVVRAEVDFPEGSDAYSDDVYKKGGDNLQQYQQDGVLIQDDQPCFYLYQQRMGEHVQVGLVAVASCMEYDQEIVRKHEYTRPDKESDRTNHINLLNAQTGPVWLTYHAHQDIDALVEAETKKEPTGSFVASDGIEHTFWVVSDEATNQKLEQLFANNVELLYIADGHHRSAAASRVAKERRENGASADAPSQHFLSVIYPHNQLQILAYNRFVYDLNGNTKESFLEKVKASFDVEETGALKLPSPPKSRQFDMFLDGSWWRLTAKDEIVPADDPVGSLDVSILQNSLLQPILDIDDPRTNKRIEFIGGIRGHKELERRVNEKEGSVSFACYATTIEQLLDVADANKVMPPKSTWFEPKLRSGLFVHLLEK